MVTFQILGFGYQFWENFERARILYILIRFSATVEPLLELLANGTVRRKGNGMYSKTFP